MKPLTFSILRLLSDNEFHSGETIAQGLGISRASVCYALRDIEEAGVTVHKVHGRGYRLLEPVQWLQPDIILKHLGEKEAGNFNLDVVDIVGSTSSFLLQRSDGAEFPQCPRLRSGGRIADKRARPAWPPMAFRSW